VCQAVLGIIYTLASSTAHSYLERKLKIKKKRKGGDGDHMQGLFKDNDEMTGLMSFLDNVPVLANSRTTQASRLELLAPVFHPEILVLPGSHVRRFQTLQAISIVTLRRLGRASTRPGLAEEHTFILFYPTLYPVLVLLRMCVPLCVCIRSSVISICSFVYIFMYMWTP
jgi:hypothetical protein